MKLDKERLGKGNTILSNVESLMSEQNILDKESFLSNISGIICSLDTDIAIYIMDNLGDEGKNQSLAIKINYGY